MPAWPNGLNFFAGYGNASRSGPVGNLIRTSMGVGPDKVRRRTTTAIQHRNGSIPAITLAQLNIFENFYTITLAGGALSFTAIDPFDNTSRTFRFVDSYSVQRVGVDRYTIEAQLEILP